MAFRLGDVVHQEDIGELVVERQRIDVNHVFFAGRAELKSWAFSIATRVAADHFANRLSIVAIAEPPEIPDSDRSLDQELVIDEMNACVRQVIDSLPEDCRAALVLHDLEGLSAVETAEIAGCTVATAKIRIHRARGESSCETRFAASLAISPRMQAPSHPLRSKELSPSRVK